MQISVNLRNQREQISSLLVSFSPTNVANIDEGLQPDFIINILQKRKKAEEKRVE